MAALSRAPGIGKKTAQRISLELKDKLTKGQTVSAAGEKVSDYRDLRRLERELQTLRQEVKLQLQAVGGMLYATHCGKPSDSDELLAKLRVIDGLEERVRTLSAQAEALRRKGK